MKKPHTSGRRETRAKLEAFHTWIERHEPITIPGKDGATSRLAPRPNRHERKAEASRLRRVRRSERRCVNVDLVAP